MSNDPLQALLGPALQAAFHQLFGHSIDAAQFTLQTTRPEFEGDVTINVFPFLKISGKGPEPTATAIGEHLQANVSVVERFNVVKGFLNIVIADSYWLGFLQEAGKKDILAFPATGKRVMVEYASPNTNKPLHLGHMRNIFLGHSVSRILEAAGNEVVRVQVINDRGIHICKSMLAWQRFGNGESPESSGLKGDKLVGKYYVEYENWSRSYLKDLLSRVLGRFRKGVESGDMDWGWMYSQRLWGEVVKDVNDRAGAQQFNNTADSVLFDDAKSEALGWITERIKSFRDPACVDRFGENGATVLLESASILEHGLSELPIRLAQEMLRKWEANDPEVRALWENMNGWCYAGFNATYDRMGVAFDKLYYESQTYVLGKEDVLKGLEKGVFYEKDGAVWVDNSPEGLDEKVLLRRDGTSVYMTQDIGTAIKRFEEYPGLSKLIYTVGNEQDYHFKVLFLILKKLGFSWADELFHLSYGMVDLPTGKMKSREGTVVDADDLIEEVVQEARASGEQLSKLDEFSEAERTALFEMIGLAAIKYYLLKVDPKKRMLFDPAASIDLQGHTGPFVQYTYARIMSLNRRVIQHAFKGSMTFAEANAEFASQPSTTSDQLQDSERALVKLLHHFPAVLHEAAAKLEPSAIANHVYELAKAYNSFYQIVPVLKEEDIPKLLFRHNLSVYVAKTIKKAMWCLGVEVPERM